MLCLQLQLHTLFVQYLCQIYILKCDYLAVKDPKPWEHSLAVQRALVHVHILRRAAQLRLDLAREHCLGVYSHRLETVPRNAGGYLDVFDELLSDELLCGYFRLILNLLLALWNVEQLFVRLLILKVILAEES